MAAARFNRRGASAALFISLSVGAGPACSAGATQYADDERNEPVPDFSRSPVGVGVPAGTATSDPQTNPGAPGGSAPPDLGAAGPAAPASEGPPNIGNVSGGGGPVAGDGAANPVAPSADPGAEPGGGGAPAPGASSTSSATCALEVSVTTVSPGGRYAPRNVGAIWVADASGQFIKSLDVWGNRRLSHVEAWNTATAAAGVPGNVVDAVTGATAVAHGAHLASWDCSDFSGQVVPDGDYRVYFEVTESNGAGPNTFAKFTKGAAAASVQTGAASFSDIALTFTP
jgi:hypothetical protein